MTSIRSPVNLLRAIHAGDPSPAVRTLLDVAESVSCRTSSEPRDLPQVLYDDVSSDLPTRLIPIYDRPYLERHFVGSHDEHYLYLHRFVNTDGDRGLHCHPWDWFSSLILCGRYVERRSRVLGSGLIAPIGIREYGPGDQNTIELNDIHQIVSIAPETWTLFAHSKWSRDWGYYPPLQRAQGAGAIAVSFVPEGGESRNRHWWARAPKGRDSGREPRLLLAA